MEILSQRLFLIVEHAVVVVAVVIVVAVVFIFAFLVGVAAGRFDVVISADVAPVVFHLVILVLFVVAAGSSNFQNDGGDFAVAWYFLEIFADYFGDLDDIVESAISRLHLTVLVDLAVFL